MNDTSDLGLRALEQVYALMMIDAEWSVRSERSFSWWPKDFAQTVSVTLPVESHGLQVCRLTASTPMVEGIPLEPRVFGLIAALNGEYGGGLSALVLDAKGTLSYVTAANVHEQVLAFVPRIFAVIAAIQATDAEIRARLLSEVLGGSAIVTAHPTSGIRTDYDDTLNVIEQLVVPSGQQPSQWVGQEMLDALALIKPRSLMAMGDANGIAFELPWGDFSSLVELNPAFEHPRIGNCLHVTLRLPDKASEQEMQKLANVLNSVEALPQMLTEFRGAWCISPSEAVTFSVVYPNALFQPGLGVNIALSMAARAEWLANLIDPRSREERWEQAQPATFQAIGTEGSRSRAGRGPDLINMMARAEGRPLYGEPGTLTPTEVAGRIEGAIHRAFQQIAGEHYEPRRTISELWEGVRAARAGDVPMLPRSMDRLRSLLTADSDGT
ncbi:MAG TPA: hypothetical protein PLE61_06310 [Vicinamibacterales bacterium]|nr:hypothetical protein [Vicinamibacterales bacterium]